MESKCIVDDVVKETLFKWEDRLSLSHFFSLFSSVITKICVSFMIIAVCFSFGRSEISTIAPKKLNKIEKLNQKLQEYAQVKPNKAFVVAIDSEKRYAFAMVSGKKSIKEAKDFAVRKCNQRKIKNAVHSSCNIYAINDSYGGKEINRLLSNEILKGKFSHLDIKSFVNCLNSPNQKNFLSCMREFKKSSKTKYFKKVSSANRSFLLEKIWKKKAKLLKRFSPIAKEGEVLFQCAENYPDTLSSCIEKSKIKY